MRSVFTKRHWEDRSGMNNGRRGRSSNETHCGRIKWVTLALAAWPIGWVGAELVRGQTVTWIDGSSDWNTAANWNPAVVPGAGDAVSIVDSDGVGRTITYDYSGPSVTLGTLTLSLSGGGPSATETLVMAAGQLTVSPSETIGSSGNGTFDQSGGTNSVFFPDGFLLLGSSSGGYGNYQLSGSNSALSPTYEYVGLYGSGSFDQYGGANSIGVDLGVNNGVYNLSAGSLSAQNEYVGQGPMGAGIVNQTGGTNLVSEYGLLNLGGFNTSTETHTTGTYILSGTGSLTVTGAELVGDAGPGYFNQTGGTNISDGVNIGTNTSYGIYSLTGGLLDDTGQLGIAISSAMMIANVTAIADSVYVDGRLSLTDLAGAASAGNLDVGMGGYEQNSSGELDIALAGLEAANQYSVLDVAGQAMLDGTLTIALVNGFAPSNGDSFEVISAGSICGAFSDVVFPEIGQYTLSYTPTGVFVTAIPEPASVALLAAGSIGLLAQRRRYR
ncbi:MAG TPA: PEP-CTERM sorting domain-containing protein [Tepidisphaeraceae bacterium]|nr:PEP-CTERM sorting domain-containing protein [Tepidisphaeraceae bacterium]